MPLIVNKGHLSYREKRNSMERIASFSVDHSILQPGLYRSRTDGGVVTYDLRFVRPNSGRLLTNAQLHSAEHLVATLLRNSRCRDAIIYFGPMGCQTGFICSWTELCWTEPLCFPCCGKYSVRRQSIRGAMPGASEKECGNCKNLSLAAAKSVCGEYLNVLDHLTPENMSYPTSVQS